MLVRLAPSVHPLAAAFWRTALVGLLLSPGIRRVERREGLMVAAAGLLLAAHFACWFASLHLTSVARSTALVCLNPVWAGLLEWRLGGERPAPLFWVGVGLAALGAAGMGGGGGEGGLLGDGLALLAGILGAAYLVVGRGARKSLPIRVYGPLLCLSAAGWLLSAALVLQIPLTGFPPEEWGALIGLAVGPQLLGHIGLNYAVGYLPAAVVSSLILLEPAGAVALAWLVLRESPATAELVGGAACLLGVLIASLRGVSKP